ncbi:MULTISPECIES: HDOD domain-containing protein [unclassified Simplicispira]|uniref:HDOD domain-containing protein n=1 Tax=unclassified Simplicispira TaxID=2630407 RepID=UPI000D5F74D1|nr:MULTISPECIES: HDOD domain-containing protein [unclassified Simplicispira]PVY56998.1 HDOD domain-containing protein [Simplicispira sp. 125]REG17943.1 HDOD domain-containing protein [Simplicispira sp. 110]
MVQSVLGSLILGYRPLWGRERALVGIQLFVRSEGTAQVDTAHLLHSLQEMWSASSPPLLITPQTRQLLGDMLEHAPRNAPWISVPGPWLAESAIHAGVQAAHRRGLRMVWRGELGSLPEPDIARCFDNSLLSLRPEDAVAALQAAPPPPRPGMPPAVPQGSSPVIGGQMYENVASRALMEHCLDERKAMALAGWPTEDVLYSLRHQQMQPAHAIILKLLKAIEAEQSLEVFEDILNEDPLLAYRFMVYTNSASLGLRTGIDSLRRGLVMMGYSSIKRWLSDQLPHANTEASLRPVREASVLRARLTEHLLQSGVQNDLRREVYLCGLFSQLDELMREPLGTILHRIPLSERIYDAIVMHTGPYAASLEMACALETEDASAIRQLCETHEMDLEEVNRALLRVLSSLEVIRPGH